MTKEEYVNKFIELCDYEIDYASNASVKENNKRARKFLKMQNNITENDYDREFIFNVLLKHSSDRVKSNAAAQCLSLGINIEEAKNVLSEVSKKLNSDELDERLTAFNAEMCLRVYNGEFPGKKL